MDEGEFDVLPLEPPARAARKRQKVPRLCLDARSLAEALGISVRAVRSLSAAGRLPRSLKLGGRVLWRAREVADWVDAGMPDRQAWEAIKAGRESK